MARINTDFLIALFETMICKENKIRVNPRL